MELIDCNGLLRKTLKSVWTESSEAADEFHGIYKAMDREELKGPRHKEARTSIKKILSEYDVQCKDISNPLEKPSTDTQVLLICSSGNKYPDTDFLNEMKQRLKGETFMNMNLVISLVPDFFKDENDTAQFFDSTFPMAVCLGFQGNCPVNGKPLELMLAWFIEHYDWSKLGRFTNSSGSNDEYLKKELLCLWMAAKAKFIPDTRTRAGFCFQSESGKLVFNHYGIHEFITERLREYMNAWNISKDPAKIIYPPYYMDTSKYRGFATDKYRIEKDTGKPKERSDSSNWNAIKKIVEQLQIDREGDYNFQLLRKGEYTGGKNSPASVRKIVDSIETALHPSNMKEMLRLNAIGVDCSGFVTRAISFIMESMYAARDAQLATLDEYYDSEKKSDTHRIYTYTGCTKSNATSIAPKKLNNTIHFKLKDAKPGDFIYISKGDHFHIKIIVEVTSNPDDNTINLKIAESSSVGQVGPKFSAYNHVKDGTEIKDLLKDYQGPVRPLVFAEFYNADNQPNPSGELSADPDKGSGTAEGTAKPQPKPETKPQPQPQPQPQQQPEPEPEPETKPKPAPAAPASSGSELAQLPSQYNIAIKPALVDGKYEVIDLSSRLFHTCASATELSIDNYTGKIPSGHVCDLSPVCCGFVDFSTTEGHELATILIMFNNSAGSKRCFYDIHFDNSLTMGCGNYAKGTLDNLMKGIPGSKCAAKFTEYFLHLNEEYFHFDLDNILNDGKNNANSTESKLLDYFKNFSYSQMHKKFTNKFKKANSQSYKVDIDQKAIDNYDNKVYTLFSNAGIDTKEYLTGFWFNDIMLLAMLQKDFCQYQTDFWKEKFFKDGKKIQSNYYSLSDFPSLFSLISTKSSGFAGNYFASSPKPVTDCFDIRREKDSKGKIYTVNDSGYITNGSSVLNTYSNLNNTYLLQDKGVIYGRYDINKIGNKYQAVRKEQAEIDRIDALIDSFCKKGLLNELKSFLIWLVYYNKRKRSRDEIVWQVHYSKKWELTDKSKKFPASIEDVVYKG